MREDELALWKLRADLPRESGKPRLRATVTPVHGRKVLQNRSSVSSTQGCRIFQLILTS